MADAFTLCVRCDVPIPDGESAHQAHDDGCVLARAFVEGICRCDGWVCLACCPEPECSPLAARLAEARAEDRARVEVAG